MTQEPKRIGFEYGIQNFHGNGSRLTDGQEEERRRVEYAMRRFYEAEYERERQRLAKGTAWGIVISAAIVGLTWALVRAIWLLF